MAATNASGVSAMRASPQIAIGPDDVADRRRHDGRPAARYSGVFVGLMKRVASLRANGSIATSHPAM